LEPSIEDRDGLNREIIDMIVAEGMIEREHLTPDATLQSLGIASVDVVLILMAIEEKFGIYVPIDGSIAESRDLRSFIDNLVDRIVESRA
jgi:acyl carrier protein